MPPVVPPPGRLPGVNVPGPPEGRVVMPPVVPPPGRLPGVNVPGPPEGRVVMPPVVPPPAAGRPEPGENVPGPPEGVGDRAPPEVPPGLNVPGPPEGSVVGPPGAAGRPDPGETVPGPTLPAFGYILSRSDSVTKLTSTAPGISPEAASLFFSRCPSGLAQYASTPNGSEEPDAEAEAEAEGVILKASSLYF